MASTGDKAASPAWAKGASTVAEVASLQLEFRALSRHTSNPSYEAVAQRGRADGEAPADHLLDLRLGLGRVALRLDRQRRN